MKTPAIQRTTSNSNRSLPGEGPTGNGSNSNGDTLTNGNGNGNGAAAVTPVESESQAPALQRGLAVLEFLAGREEGATLSEISAALGLSPASSFRLTGVLEDSGYVLREETSRRFRLSRKLLRLGQPQHEGRSLVECCLPAMREVLAQTGETVQLCCLAEHECVMIEQLPSTHPFKYIVDLGSRPPIHCCAPGKAMLAYLPEPALGAALAATTFTTHTPRTLTTAEALVESFGKIRERGFAVDQGEHFEGIHCVAAPLLDRHGHPVAAITIAGPSTRIQARRFNEYGRIMKQAAAQAALRYLG
ncbi:IclR family transcriptional regulator [Roseimicrobium gellanilyticum]|uniref:IclR family transcriptional regulator n=1 Tax=Roseimicrobium gellanilyticum TaxID=748857 RepID=A0A366HXP7_9BACT|nr:IclR family transcriptional regulator [Roseimicrobium gellanilyticum]RBP48265.1 IclR family transcriptional regulator [Roseimicrobium gellanilyticum]